MGVAAERIMHSLPHLFQSRDERRAREACYPFETMPSEGFVEFDITAENQMKEFDEQQLLEAKGLAAQYKAEGIRK